MLAVHWSPVSNTKNILKNGISKSKKGLFCFPITGHKYLDRWWVYFFNQCRARGRKHYNGFVFRLKEQDMPAYFGHWVGATNKSDFDKEIRSLRQLGNTFKEAILWRLGEAIAVEENLVIPWTDHSAMCKMFMELAEEEVSRSPKALAERMRSLDFMAYTLDDYQIVLSHSIEPQRILKILPQGNEFGKILKRQKQEGKYRFDGLD